MSKLKNLLKSIYRKFIKLMLGNKPCYYDRFLGSNKSKVLNMLGYIKRPAFTYKKIIYNGNSPLPSSLLKCKRIENLKLSEAEQRQAEELKENGILFYEENFSDIADHVLNKYSDFFADRSPSDGYKRSFSVEIDDKILQFMLHRPFLNIIANYFNAMPYLRCCCGFNITYPDRLDTPSYEQVKTGFNKKYADLYHLDTPLLLQIHMFLNDTTLEHPHMLYAKRSNQQQYHSLFTNFSEEFVRDNFEVVDCVGKKGNLYIFDGGSGIHRMYPTKGHYRMTMDVLFTPGTNIIQTIPIKNLHELNLDQLDDMQRECLKYMLQGSVEQHPPQTKIMTTA